MEAQVEKDPDFIVDAGKKQATPLSTYSRKRKSNGAVDATDGGDSSDEIDRKDVKKSKPRKASSASSNRKKTAKQLQHHHYQQHNHHHPPYLEMITEAILALNERHGSSLPAIAKYLKASVHGDELPENFRKMLSLQLKHQVEKGNLVKVKNSFKLSPSMRRAATQSLRRDSKGATRKSKPRKAKKRASTTVKRG